MRSQDFVKLTDVIQASRSQSKSGSHEQLCPDIRQLADCVSFSPEDGRIWLNDQRMLLVHNSSFGALRRELIESLGHQSARGLLTRSGYASGARDAQLVRQRWPGGDIDALLKAGTALHALEGIVKVEIVHLDFDIEAGTYDGEFLWRHSSEDDEHILAYGIGTESACWMELGYAIGYVSTLLGRLIIFREVECRATGADVCRIIGKAAEQWDSIEDDLQYINPHHFVSNDPIKSNRHSPKEIIDVPNEVAADPAQMIGASSAFVAACNKLQRVAPTRATVLLSGESGVGKELFASMLHKISRRCDKPFVAVNCAAVPETLIESELFGIERGAYTGASQARPGRFERADGGTLFLDEIGLLSSVAQGKLLRALQEGEIERLGGTKIKKVDVRVVAATNVDLREAVGKGHFREDLFFRLNVFPIQLPALRERRDDVPLLMNHFLRRFSALHGKPVTGFTARAVTALLHHDFPGNIRELQNLIERAVIYADDDAPIDLVHLFTQGERMKASVLSIGSSGELAAAGAAALDNAPNSEIPSLIGSITSLLHGQGGSILSLDELEKNLISEAVEQSRGNLSEAARRLGITRPQLAYRLKRAQINL
jgi:transcriptional regulator with GAF, ATPase, and Fis domain